jgi:hypothetical protein
MLTFSGLRTQKDRPMALPLGVAVDQIVLRRSYPP